MISRYTRPEMGRIWESHMRFEKMMEVEIAVAQAQAKLKIIPVKAAQEIKRKAKFEVLRIAEIEAQTKHDVIAFVTNLAENVGEMGRYVHYGLTSSDVLDTATSLQIREAFLVLLKSLDRLKVTFERLIKKHEASVCVGRTHGMFAEPTTFGFKLAGFYSELLRNEERLTRALNQSMIVKLSGAVGTYSAQSIEVEKLVAGLLKLQPETVATQVVPRDRHAEVIWSIGMLGSGLERLAIELRHLQRSEVAEVVEGFTPGQKGSSAMPHKKNPISAENITGLSRLLRSYVQASLENIPLWHERDISHSSVERVILGDAFIVADYAVDRMEKLLRDLYIDIDQMHSNLELSQGMVFSSHVLLALVEKGLTREKAYEKVQALSHGLKKGEHLKHKVLADKDLKKLLSAKEVQEIFSGAKHQKNIHKVIARLI